MNEGTIKSLLLYHRTTELSKCRGSCLLPQSTSSPFGPEAACPVIIMLQYLGRRQLQSHYGAPLLFCERNSSHDPDAMVHLTFRTLTHGYVDSWHAAVVGFEEGVAVATVSSLGQITSSYAGMFLLHNGYHLPMRCRY